jgi:hypothetical protein
MKKSVAASSLMALVSAWTLVTASCGGIEIGFPFAFDAGPSPFSRDAGRAADGGAGAGWGGDDGYDASPDWPSTWDGTTPQQEPDPDGGPPAAIACGPDADAGAENDSGVECPLPPSVCLDDQWARYYYGGTCGDAGVCEYQYYDMFCEPSGMPHDCYQGGCRVMVLR